MSTQNILIYPLPTLETTDCNENNILWDLGKATKRGTKKCPDCGTINGTRCYMCKNPVCHRILKANDKHKVHIDAIKLITGMARKIYSVRVRDKGCPDPDQRGFVQLPCAFYERDRLNEVALCFVNNCERSYSILKCHEDDDEEDDINTGDNALNFCVHMETAAKSLSVAHATEFKHDLINNLKAGDDIKKKLCSLAKSTEGPLVQRIAKSVLAIKCFVNSTHPLGYLHFTLEYKRGNNNDEEIESYHCECNNIISGNKCLHYYACVCAFASDAKLLHKNLSFVQHEFDKDFGCEFNMLVDESKDNSYPMENIRIEILQPELLGIPQLATKSKKAQRTVKNKRQKSDFTNNQTNLNKQNDNVVKIHSNNIIKSSSIIEMEETPQNNNILIDSNPNFSYDVLKFQDWFISVIERINDACSQNIQNSSYFFDVYYQQNIQEVKLSFHISDKFIDLFKELLYSLMRNYQPHNCSLQTAAATSNDTDVFGAMQFTISDITQVELLFTTPAVKLSRYQLLVSEQWPFRITWSSNVFKLSKFGELQLIFIKQFNVS